MKLLGIIMVLISASGVGFYIGSKYISVLKGIKRAENFIGSIILELKNERLTLSQMFENAAALGDMSTQSFIKNLSFQNLNNISKIALESGFCPDESALAVLNEAFSVLGKYSAADQITELEFCKNKLHSIYEKNEENLLAKAKLSRSFGILSGIFFAIILL